VPSGCGRDDCVGVGFPAERLRLGVVFGEVAVDGGLATSAAASCCAALSRFRSSPRVFDLLIYLIRPGGE
jgi:endonuclease V-like protein UPF0215 family